MKCSVWRHGDRQPDLGVLVQFVVHVCMHMHTRVFIVSADRFSASAGSELSPCVCVVVLQAPRENVFLANGLECTVYIHSDLGNTACLLTPI